MKDFFFSFQKTVIKIHVKYLLKEFYKNSHSQNFGDSESQDIKASVCIELSFPLSIPSRQPLHFPFSVPFSPASFPVSPSPFVFLCFLPISSHFPFPLPLLPPSLCFLLTLLLRLFSPSTFSHGLEFLSLHYCSYFNSPCSYIPPHNLWRQE